MTGSRGRWIAAAVAALFVVGAASVGVALREGQGTLPERPAAERPELPLLTSLPIVFPEEFTLDAPASPALQALRSRYDVVPISLSDRQSLRGHRLLLMAQPQAQPAEVLVELDAWVRAGGRVVILADPSLAWPSERPLGDVLRPPIFYPDTGLLGHWGLRLDSPDRPGPRLVTVDGREVTTVSPGTLVATGTDCAVGAAGLIARCRIGRGEATVIADADFLNQPGSKNLDLLLGELERLER